MWPGKKEYGFLGTLKGCEEDISCLVFFLFLFFSRKNLCCTLNFYPRKKHLTHRRNLSRLWELWVIRVNR